jgi:hypothetical protein
VVAREIKRKRHHNSLSLSSQIAKNKEIKMGERVAAGSVSLSNSTPPTTSHPKVSKQAIPTFFPSLSFPFPSSTSQDLSQRLLGADFVEYPPNLTSAPNLTSLALHVLLTVFSYHPISFSAHIIFTTFFFFLFE